MIAARALHSVAGLLPRDVWAMTPAEVDFLLDVGAARWKRDQTLADFRAAQLCALVANVYRDPKKHAGFTPKDFMIDYDAAAAEPQEQAPDDMLALVRAMNRHMGGHEP